MTVARSSTRRTTGARVLAVALLLAGSAGAQGAPTATAKSEQKRNAKQHLDAAAAAERKKDFPTAAAEYRAAHALDPTPVALQGIATAEESLDHPIEAIVAYEQLIAQFGSALPAKARATAATHLAALAPKIGTIAVRVTPDGASISVDGKPVGVTPLAKPIRVLPGVHRVAATLPAFLPVDRTLDVGPGAEVAAEFAMTSEPTAAQVSVVEAKGAVLTLSIDGKAVGALPWAGDVEPGSHEFSASSNSLLAPPQTIAVEKGKKIEVTFVAVPRVGHLDLHTSNGQGFIVIDGKPAAEGNYEEALPIGPHRVAFVREGFERVEIEHDLVEGETWRQLVTLRPVSALEPSVAQRERGVVGNLLLTGSFQINSAGSESEANCNTLGSQCSDSTPAGGGLLFAVGYMWRYIGFDVLAGGVLDNASRAYADANGAPKSYDVARVGAMQALRARGTIQTDHFRGVAAMGPGLSERFVGIAKGFPSLPKDTSTYVSLAFTIDVNGQWRMGASTALVLGMMLWVDNAGDGVTTLSAPTTGSFHLVSGTQAFFLPYLGLQFGP